MSKEEFKVLDARQHVITRPNMYVGSTSLETFDRFILGKWNSVSYVPALVKMVDELIDNCIDEAIRTNFKHANIITVWIADEYIRVEDNGRGIPQDIVSLPTGEKVKRPIAAWTQTNSGTSFTDERTTIGTNGVGSACVNFLSKTFQGVTSNGKNMMVVGCIDGKLDDVTDTKTGGKETYTKVTFTPELKYFDVKSIHDFEISKLIKDRLLSLSVNYPKIKFFMNDVTVDKKDQTGVEVTTNIRKYSHMFLEKDHVQSVVETSNDLSFFFVSSDDGYQVTSYINGVNTRLGGTYSDYVIDQVAEHLSAIIKKKEKITVSKPVIKSGLKFVCFVKNFTNPKFDSQTKERLTNTRKEVVDHFNLCKVDLEKVAQQLFTKSEIITPIMEAEMLKRLAKEKKDAKAAQNKLKKAKCPKHVPANGKENMLFITEGESALGYAIDVRDTNKHGFYPARGVPLNTWDKTPKEVLENAEMSDIVNILNLDITKADSYKNLSYKKIILMTDADADGLGHIAPLFLAFFYKFWPNLFNEGKMYILRTPIMISTKAKKVEWFYSYKDAKEFKEKNSGWKHRYIKGLGSLDKSEYKEIINNPVLDKITIDDPKWFEVMFGKDSGERKKLMSK